MKNLKNPDEDNGCNTSGNETFEEVLDARVSRRGLISSGLAVSDCFSLGGVDPLLRAVPASAQVQNQPLMGFQVGGPSRPAS